MFLLELNVYQVETLMFFLQALHGTCAINHKVDFNLDNFWSLKDISKYLCKAPVDVCVSAHSFFWEKNVCFMVDTDH